MQAPSPDKPKSDPFELLPAILILGFAGGFFDAYTYVARGGVFCNAQTGNLILMTLGICGGEGIRALRYLIPVAFFVLANIVGDITYRAAKKRAEKKGIGSEEGRFLYQSAILATETAILTVVGFIPVTFPALLPNALISSVAALQYHAFRDMNGVALSTVFCTNNLRLLSSHLFTAAADKDKLSLKKAGYYILLIALFIAGVTAGYFLTVWAKQYAILSVSALFVLLGLGIFLGRRNNKRLSDGTEKEVL